jgi:DnaJ-class molecular chaperone
MTHPLPALKAEASRLSKDIAGIRKAIASYAEPLDAAFVAFVESQGPTALAELQAKSAAWVREQETELTDLEAQLAAVEANIEITRPSACWRCDGDAEYHGPTSHYRGGRPICFHCGGTGYRKES